MDKQQLFLKKLEVGQLVVWGIKSLFYQYCHLLPKAPYKKIDKRNDRAGIISPRQYKPKKTDVLVIFTTSYHFTIKKDAVKKGLNKNNIFNFFELGFEGVPKWEFHEIINNKTNINNINCYGHINLEKLSIQENFKLIINPDGRFEGKNLTFNGTTFIRVYENGRLNIGSDATFENSLEIRCKENILIGNDCMFSTDIKVLDYDGHDVLVKNKIVNKPRKITIGNHVWVGTSSIILKGSIIRENSIVAAGSVVSGQFPPNSAIAGNPAKIVKKNVMWER